MWYGNTYVSKCITASVFRMIESQNQVNELAQIYKKFSQVVIIWNCKQGLGTNMCVLTKYCIVCIETSLEYYHM